MKRIHRVFARLLFLLLMVESTETAWSANGKIAGKVTDKKTGEALIGCNVVVEGTSMGAATDVEGFYAILNVPPGIYTLSVSLVGYSHTKIKDIRVNIDLTATIDVQLNETVLDIGQEVVIIAERPLIKKDQTAKTAVIGRDELSALPVNEFSQVIAGSGNSSRFLPNHPSLISTPSLARPSSGQV